MHLWSPLSLVTKGLTMKYTTTGVKGLRWEKPSAPPASHVAP